MAVINFEDVKFVMIDFNPAQDVLHFDGRAAAGLVFTAFTGSIPHLRVAHGGAYVGLQGVVYSSLSTANFSFGDGSQAVFGTAGNDGPLVGTDQADFMDGLDGNDALNGGLGGDQMRGGAGDDTLIGGGGSDTLLGGHDNDHLDGGDDADAPAADQLLGGFGDDTLIGGRGGDLLDGSVGNDLAIIDFSDATGDLVFNYPGSSSPTGGVLTVDGATELTARGIERFTLIGGSGDDLVSMAGAADTVIGGAGNDTLDGGEGADDLTGGTGSDSLIGGGGVDTLVLDGGGTDTVLAGDGNDGINVTGLGVQTMGLTIDGGNGTDGAVLRLTGSATTLIDIKATGDTLIKVDGVEVGRMRGVELTDIMGGDGRDVLKGGNAADILSGALGDDQLLGRLGRDQLFGGDGKDLLDGGDQDDLLEGGGGKDTLKGGNNNDVLVGGADADNLFGGTGADRFVYLAAGDSNFLSAGRDRISDFRHMDGDRIDLSAIDAIAGTSPNDGFTWTSGFHGAAGEIYAVYNSKAQLYNVFADLNGDRVADFAINVKADAPLTESDFLL